MTPGGMQPSIPTKSGLWFTLTVLVYATKREPRGKTFLDENIRFSSLNSSLSLSLPFRVLFFFLSFLDFFSTRNALLHSVSSGAQRASKRFYATMYALLYGRMLHVGTCSVTAL